MGLRQVLCYLIVLAVCAELVLGGGYEERIPRPRQTISGGGFEGRTIGPDCPVRICRCPFGVRYYIDSNGCRLCTCNSAPPSFTVPTPPICPPGARPVLGRASTCLPSQLVSIWPTQNTCRRERGEFCSGGLADGIGTCCVFARMATPQNVFTI